MAPHSVLRIGLLVSSSVLLTVVLGFGLPALLNAIMRMLGLPETSVTECIVVIYAAFVLYVATPRIPRGSVEVREQSGNLVFFSSLLLSRYTLNWNTACLRNM